MPWVNRPLNGSAMPSSAEVLQRPGPEARVEQVQDRMLDPADILRDRQPCLGLGAVERLVRRLAGEADEVPARIDERVERVGLALRLAAALRAIDMLPASDGGRAGCPGLSKSTSSGRTTGSWSRGHRHRAAAVAVDDRDRRAPIALARHAPVAQPLLGRALAPAGGLGAADDFGDRLLGGQPVEELGVDRDSRRSVSASPPIGSAATFAAWRDDALDRQLILLRELEVALVVAGNAENRARAIVHQHEVGDVDRQPPVGSSGWTASSAVR